MKRLLWLPLISVVIVGSAAQAWAGGFVCWMADLEKQGKVDDYAAELRAEGPEGFTKALEILEGLNNQLRRSDERKQIAATDSDAEWSETITYS